MVRSPRPTVAAAALAALLAIAAGIAGRAQDRALRSGVVVDTFAPPAIDRGLTLDVSRAPDTPETRQRASIRLESAPPERLGPGGARYVAGKVIVKFRDGVSSAARLSAMSVSSTRSIEQPAYADFQLLRIDPGHDPAVVAAALAASPEVEYATPAYRWHTMLTPNDPLYARQWNLPLIDMPRAWDIQPQAGSSITVAVLDTGIAYTNVTMRYHASAFTDSTGQRYPALGDLTLPFVMAPELAPASRFVSPRDFIWHTTVPVDLDGHGTHVSGTIGQATNNGVGTAGVAFNVKLMPVKVISGEWDDIFGSPDQGTDDIVAQGIRYAADNGANVINMSIGRTGPSTCGTNPNASGCAPAVESAIKYAVGKGVFISIAAGNDFETGNPTEVIAEIASRVQGAVSVGAVDQSSARAYYSSTGSWVEIAAPGGSFRAFGAAGGILQQTLDLGLVETFTSPPSRFIAPRFDAVAYYYFTGTSQATPHVSGLAAMLMQQGITDPAAVEAALERFATDLGTTGRDNEFGFGLLSARNTLRGLGLAK